MIKSLVEFLFHNKPLSKALNSQLLGINYCTLMLRQPPLDKIKVKLIK